MSEPNVRHDSDPSFPCIPEIVLERIVGDGGSGIVYAGRQSYLDRPIAVKVLKRHEDLPDASFVQRFHREAKILAALRHPHIVACHQAGITEQGAYYLAMEFIDGSDLHQWLVQHGPLTEIQALEVVRTIASALEYALDHGIIHRDVKPENILLQRNDLDDEAFPFEAKLADLGVARPVSIGDTRVTVAAQIVGTPRNMAPEQFGDPDGVDFRADLYGLGCVLFQILTGVHPFAETDPVRLIMDKAKAQVPDPVCVRPGLHAGVVSLVRSLLAPDKEQRPKSYGEVTAACERLKTELMALPTQARLRKKRSANFIAVILLCTFAAAYLLSEQAREGPDVVSQSQKPPAASKTMPDAPSVSPNPAAEVEFEERGEALLSGDFSKPFRGWDPRTGQANWIAEEEGGGINGIGSGHKARELGPAPWRVDGSMALLTEDSKEAGIRIELEPRGAVVLALKKLDKLYASLVEIPGTAVRTAPRILSFSPVYSGFIEQITFSLVFHKDRVRAVLGGRVFGEFPLNGSAHAIVLFVNGATASFRDLVIHRPVS